ncbi:filamentous hemagglutinin N-terminal domain-containing protein, partial [Campylobacter lari subsp. concheus]
WGGGFNIGKNEQVNFNGSNKNYLNIAHGTSKSTIEGILNASGNNVFLINPNGVIITKTGTINANRFVASTSSMSDDNMKAFANLKSFDEGLSFSPVFKTQKAGNVVNMGNINTNDVLLIGNKVDIQGGHINGKHNDGVSGDTLKNPSGNAADKVHLVGNEVNILADGIKSNSIIASAYVKGSLQQSTISYYNYGNNIGKLQFETDDYSNIDKTNLGNKKLVTKDKFEKHATIGSDIDWFYFAKGWNENKNGMRDFFGTYKLTSDIDFNGDKGQGVEGKDWQNYANYCLTTDNCTSMIVGTFNNPFSKTFDGQGYTLKNINISNIQQFGTDFIRDFQYSSIFGSTKSAYISNLNINDFYFDSYASGVGALVGYANASKFDKLYFDNINIKAFNATRVGGIIGSSYKNTISNLFASNIMIKNNVSFQKLAIGGFAGSGIMDTYNNIVLSDISIESKNGSAISGVIQHFDVGGFNGLSSYSNYENIILDSLIVKVENKYPFIEGNFGYFSGFLEGQNTFKNIYTYYNPKSSIETVYFKNNGLFFGNKDTEPLIEKVQVYYHNSFKNDNPSDDQFLDYNGIEKNKIQVYFYEDVMPEKPDIGIILPEKPTDPSNPDFNVILDEDDLLQEMIKKEIINDITNGKYELHISDLLKMLEDRLNYFNMNENQKVEFIAKYFLGGDKTQALEVIQSLNFILAYENNGLSTASKDKFKGNGFIAKEEILKQTSNTAKNINDKINQLDNELKSLVISSDKYLKDLIVKQNKLNEIIKAYNNYVALINKGLANESDPEFITLKNQINTLMSESDVLA